MHFIIITPSFNQLDHLKRCIASVADQIDGSGFFSIHHHIQDGESKDGTVEFLQSLLVNGDESVAKGYTFSFSSESDQGMYDAINRGLECSAKGENNMFAWLNCDEQYLPETLNRVARYVDGHNDVDIIFGGMLMIDERGGLLSCRKAMPMRRLFLEASYLYNFSCGMFFRPSVWSELGGFNSAYRAAGDADFIDRALIKGFRTAHIKEILSTFIYSSSNLSSEDVAVREHTLLQQNYAAWLRYFRLPINMFRLAEKALLGGYSLPSSFTYSIYMAELSKRSEFKSDKPKAHWPDEPRPNFGKHRNEYS